MRGILLTLLMIPGSAFGMPNQCGPSGPLEAIDDCPETLIPPPRRSPDTAKHERVRQAFAAIAQAKTREERIREEIDGLNSKISRLPLKAFFEKARQMKERDAKVAELQSSIKDRFNRRNAAIVATIDAFGLTPTFTTPPPGARLVSSIKPWKPQYTECEAVDAVGGCHELSDTERKADNNTKLGATMHAGAQIWIYPGAFDSPERLAAVIFHEGIHWIHTVKRGGVRPSPEEYFSSEKEAYARQSAAAVKLGLMSEAGKWKARSVEEAQHAAGVVGKSWGWVKMHRPDLMRKVAGYAELPWDAHLPSDSESLRRQSETDFLESVVRQGRELSAARERSAADERRRNEEAEARRRAALPPAGPPLDPYWEAMRKWTLVACGYLEPFERIQHENLSDPAAIGWAVEENERRHAAKKAADAAARGYLLKNFVVMDRRAMEARLAEAVSMDACQRDIIRMMAKADAPISVDWLIGQLDYRKGGGALGEIVRAIGRGVSAGASALASGIRAPFIAVDEVITAIGGESAPVREEAVPSAPSSESDSPRRERPEREALEPRGVSLPWCMQGEGRRCIRR